MHLYDLSESLGKGRCDMKRFFYYILFPYILLMRGLYRFIKTEGTMFYAFMLFFVPIHICVMQNRSAEVCNGNVHNSALLF